MGRGPVSVPQQLDEIRAMLDRLESRLDTEVMELRDQLSAMETEVDQLRENHDYFVAYPEAPAYADPPEQVELWGRSDG